MNTILFLGFIVGMKHAIEADHVAAVASLASNERSWRKIVRHGAVWGVGHTLTLFLFGGAAILAGAAVSESLARAMEFTVGVMLIGLGAHVLYRLARDRIHYHIHRRGDGRIDVHAHSHSDRSGRRVPDRHEHGHPGKLPMRTLLVGMTHGLAGSAALVLLTAASAPSAPLGLLYIAIFGVGSIAGMALLSATISVPMTWAAKSLTIGYGLLQFAIGAITVGIGGVVLYGSAFAAPAAM